MLPLYALALASLAAAACSGPQSATHDESAYVTPAEPDFGAVAARSAPDTSAPGFGDSRTYGPQLGVNYTWASDKRIDGNPDPLAGAFQHVRYFQLMEKDYGEGNTPATTILEPCTNVDNPWACPENSMNQHLVRVLKFREMFPGGVIWIAPDVYGNGDWPCKGWSAEQLGDDPEEAGYRWGQAAFETYGAVEGPVVVAMTNEEWCPGEERVAAYDAWRRGVIRAHRENPATQLAVGARHVRPKMWHGERLTDNVADVSPAVWAYVDSVGGWADYHAHGVEGDTFLSHDDAAEATDYRDFFAWSNWLQRRYPNIRRAVGEIAYTTSPNGVVASDEEKRADWPTYSGLVEALAEEAEIVFLYQIEDHPWPEGAFSGSGVYPALMDSVRALATTPR